MNWHTTHLISACVVQVVEADHLLVRELRDLCHLRGASEVGGRIAQRFRAPGGEQELEERPEGRVLVPGYAGLELHVRRCTSV